MRENAVAYALGALGAVPFVALTPQCARALRLDAVSGADGRARMQIAYGGSILSFLGGVHWGLALSGGAVNAAVGANAVATRYAWSVTPSLLAAAACGMTSEVAACGTLIGGLGACAGIDTMYEMRGGYPKWMMPMRYALTAVAAASLSATAFRDVGDERA